MLKSGKSSGHKTFLCAFNIALNAESDLLAFISFERSFQIQAFVSFQSPKTLGMKLGSDIPRKLCLIYPVGGGGFFLSVISPLLLVTTL